MRLIASLYKVVLFATAVFTAGCAVSPTSETEFDLSTATASFDAHVKALADDRMEGRSPSSVGESRTLEYLTDAYTAMGLEPVGDSFLQPVPLVAVTAQDITDLEIAGADDALIFEYGREMMVWTKQLVSRSQLDMSEIVFVGYGIVAPEHGWNDYAGIDVEGKTVMVLVNDPGFATQDPAVFNGNAMTYYGRWTYKYEEAARQGATGVLIVHETEAAGYPWQVVTGSWAGEQFDLIAADKNLSRSEVEGWVSQRAAEKILALGGQNYQTLRDAASQPGFAAVPVPLTATVAFNNTVRESESNNVAGILRGTTHPDETIIFSSHWDHLGLAPSGADRVFNGAQDNAAGVAMMLAIGEALARGERPERSILLLAVTAEESGLLGSAWYGENPLVPLETSVANINLDAPRLLGPSTDVSVVGFGNSELDSLLAPYVEAQGRVLVQEPTPEKGFFYRSDHFNFAKRGVPALYAKSGLDHRELGEEFGAGWEQQWVAQRYHKVGDEYDPDWDLRGVAEDMEVFFELTEQLANSRLWPEWTPGNEFRAAREESREARN